MNIYNIQINTTKTLKLAKSIFCSAKRPPPSPPHPSPQQLFHVIVYNLTRLFHASGWLWTDAVRQNHIYWILVSFLPTIYTPCLFQAKQGHEFNSLKGWNKIKQTTRMPTPSNIKNHKRALKYLLVFKIDIHSTDTELPQGMSL